MGFVVLDQRPQLLLLQLPNIVTLATVWEYLNTIWHIDSRLQGPASAQLANRDPIRLNEVLAGTHRACPHTLVKGRVLAHRVRVSLHWNVFLILGIVMIVTTCGKGD